MINPHRQSLKAMLQTSAQNIQYRCRKASCIQAWPWSSKGLPKIRETILRDVKREGPSVKLDMLSQGGAVSQLDIF